MSQFIDLLKGHVNQNMISKAAQLLEENTSNISAAVDSIFAGLMGVLTKDGKDFQIKNLFDEAGNLDLLSNAEASFDEKQSQNQQNVSDNFLQTLLGDKAAKFTQGITEKTGISTVAANRLISMLTPIFVGFFGKKVKEKNWTATQLRNEIVTQKNSFVKYIPSSILQSFGISQVLQKEVEDMDHQDGKKKKNNWWIWTVIIALLLLLLLWWKSCKNDCCASDSNEKGSTTYIESDRSNSGNAGNTSTTNTQTSSNMYETTLPNGVKLNLKKGSMEEKMIAFLNSDEYKNATDNDLKNKWFEFEDVHFKFNSSTELTDESQLHINNIAEIVKAYKDTKVRIGAYADKVGSEKVNMEISKGRAKTIESILDKKGLTSQILTAEGFGEEFATHNANESDSERAKDRDIALRFTK